MAYYSWILTFHIMSFMSWMAMLFYLPRLFVYHVEHVVARQHGGGDSLSNLALSCRHCNLLKGPNLTSLDPDNRTLVRLFDPRTQAWNEHFALVDGQIRGLTEIGRTTVFLLEMNAPHRVELRLVNRP